MNNKEEIKWNIINAILAGLLVFFGSSIDGNITIKGIIAALFAGLIVGVTKFKEYWEREEEEYKSKVFNFINF